MYSFKNDYSEGAHENILKAMIETNLKQTDGYGEDFYCQEAKKAIKDHLGDNEVDIHFLVGGTQTNLTAIGAFLRPYEAVIAPCTGHVLTHETGAIEATGHKVISVPSEDGKIRADQIRSVVNEHIDEHMVMPRMVYISNPTELGTIYNKSDIESIKAVCKEAGLLLYIDGARLASALTCDENDLTLNHICEYADAFYIGGTKCGAYMGEALVICNDKLKENFRYNIKQRGGLFAKGRILGIQFLQLFKDNLYFQLGNYANDMAMVLRKGIEEKGYEFLIKSSTNQLFPILPNEIIEKLQRNFDFIVWSKVDENNSSIRLVTSWATQEHQVEAFLKDL